MQTPLLKSFLIECYSKIISECSTSAYLACKSNKLAWCAFKSLSPTQSSATIVRKLFCKESSAVARTQPLVVTPETITESTCVWFRWLAKLVSKKALANFFSISISSLLGDRASKKDVSSDPGFKIFKSGSLDLKTLASNSSR